MWLTVIAMLCQKTSQRPDAPPGTCMSGKWRHVTTHKESPNSFPKGAPQASSPAKADGYCSQHPPAHHLCGPSPDGEEETHCVKVREQVSAPLPGLHPKDWR